MPPLALIIDDEASVRALCRRVLVRVGWSVLEGRDGEDGLAQLGELAAHLVLSDVHMEGVDGIELHRRLRADRPELLARLVLMTGAPDDPRLVALIRTGEVRVLRKPFSVAELIALAECFARLDP